MKLSAQTLRLHEKAPRNRRIYEAWRSKKDVYAVAREFKVAPQTVRNVIWHFKRGSNVRPRHNRMGNLYPDREAL